MSDGWEIDYGEWGSDPPATDAPTTTVLLQPPAAWDQVGTTPPTVGPLDVTEAGAGMPPVGGSVGYIIVAFILGGAFTSVRLRARRASKAWSMKPGGAS